MKILEKFSDIRRLVNVFRYYRSAFKINFKTREALEQHQYRLISRHLDWIAKNSPYYAGYAGKALEDWPLIDKTIWMSAFDAMNTAGLRLDDALSVARKAEETRDFEPFLQGFTVGLSSGTSGHRGVFVVSSEEREQWAGMALAKLLPGRLFAGERVAFFLRANSTLYTSVASPWLTFRFFDLLSDFDQLLPDLENYRPSIVVAPAQVLAQLALAKQAARLKLDHVRIISVAEVLEHSDRCLLENTLGTPDQVYQATEGFLGCTCPSGKLHLNEDFYHIEPWWIDEAKTRMMPIITDLKRRTQPLVRYRLNDVLVVGSNRCECGAPSRVIERIEGRNDDMLILPGTSGMRPVFADAISRILLNILPLETDYRLIQTAPGRLCLQAPIEPLEGDRVLNTFRKHLEILGVQARDIEISFISQAIPFDPLTKRRRITRQMG